VTGPHGRDGVARRQDGTERSPWSRRVLIGVAVVLVPELASNVFANAFSDTGLGKWLGAHIALVVAVLGVAVIGLYLVMFWLERRRPTPSAVAQGPSEGFGVPQPQPLPAWYPFPTRLHGRDRVVERALKVLRYRGMVAVVGPRDVGTSSVANRVVARLVEEGHIVADSVVWVDLRGRSSTAPPGARSVAGRLLSTFNLDEPADDTPPVLAGAAARLVSAMRERSTVLLLDNVFHAEQVLWLTRAWPAGDGLPMLVVVGDRPVANAVTDDIAVRVDALGLPAMRAILSDEAGESHLRRGVGTVMGLVRDLFGNAADPVDELLRTFRGRPRAVRDIAGLLRAVDLQKWSLNLSVDQLRAPGGAPLVTLWAAVLPQLLDHLSPRAVALLRALAVLPVTGLGRGAMDALLPAEQQSEVERGDPVAELCGANVVQESPPGRFRLPQEVRLAIGPVDGTRYPDAMWDAVAGLVHYYAVRATSWADALRTAAEARSAIVWLHREEPLLRALLTDWHPEPDLLTRLLTDLAAIADALDVWYMRELQSDGLLRTSKGLAALAEPDRPDLVRLAHLRMAAAHRIGTHLRLADESIGPAEPDDKADSQPSASALRARCHHERALIAFDRASIVGDRQAAAEHLNTAETELLLARNSVPEGDANAEVCVLVNLAAVALARVANLEAGTRSDQERKLEHRRQLAGAVGHLDDALNRARAAADDSTIAQVVELQGVVALREAKHRHAVGRWQEALGRYRDVGEEQGQARCLQHLGTLALHDGDIADLLDNDKVPEGPDRCALVAGYYLSRGDRLRAGQPKSGLTDHYLCKIEQRLGPSG
jgi:hypothetical protein